jgi:DNA-binding beta-propeller fold protein YncE
MSSQFAIAFPADPTQRDLAPILVPADPGALVFDQSSQALLVADGYSGAIVRVEQQLGVFAQRRIATIEAGGVVATNRIGGMTVAPDGTLYVTRVGYGQSGAVFRVTPGITPQALPKLPARPWRGAITYDAGEQRLYATQYQRSSSGAFDGAIVELDRHTGAVSMLMDGFLHPVGIAKVGPTLVVTDARQRAVFRVGLAAGRAVLRLQLAGDVDRPDAICACGEDSVLVTSYDDVSCRGSVRRIWLDGHVRVLAQGSWEPRGVATDGERVFVAMRRSGTVMVFQLHF